MKSGPAATAAGPSTVKTASSTATGGTEHVSGTAAADACEGQGGSAAAGACEGQGRAVTLPTGSDAPPGPQFLPIRGILARISSRCQFLSGDLMARPGGRRHKRSAAYLHCPC